MNDSNQIVSESEASAPVAAPHGHIRSFVLRQGRVSAAQARYRDEGMPRFGLPYVPGLLEFPAIFGRRAPTILEIGCGMGETTATIAESQPQYDFVGIEVHTPGVGSLCKQIATRELSNLRIIQHDAVDVVREMIAPDSLAGIHVFFPDPWPKKRQQKRRLLQPPFVQLLAQRLTSGGYLHCATDWQDYAEQMLDVLTAESLLKNTVETYAPRPDYRPETKFETRGLRLGHGVWDLVFRRLA